MITPDSQSSNWGVEPRRIVWPGRSHGMSFAEFGGESADRLVLESPADHDTHILTVALNSHFVAMEVDGRTVSNGPTRAGDAILLRSGQRPAALVCGDWDVVQFFIPDSVVRSVASDLELPAHCADDLQGPRFARDPTMLATGRRLLRRIDENDVPTRLELDELALGIVEHLLFEYSPHRIPRFAARSFASMLSAVDADGRRDYGLDDLAADTGRSIAEWRRWLVDHPRR